MQKCPEANKIKFKMPDIQLKGMSRNEKNPES